MEVVTLDLNLQGETVTRVSFDAAITILTDGDYELRVETEAVVRTPAGEVLRFDPERSGAATVHLRQLVNDVITSAEVGDAGDLLMGFESGAELSVAADSDYEAWGLVGSNGRRATCMPGGEIALWGEQPR
ncbi:DUF6188 family protein [Micromonospora trifolii]|uniref:DUF6188 family protein n=1 Tax=Micromonospora trifolii TaxID=2911208 RepID=UPI003CF1F43B